MDGRMVLMLILYDKKTNHLVFNKLMKMKMVYANIFALNEPKKKNNLKNELFGIWKNRKDLANVDGYVRQLRKGRFHFPY
jgi:hypothetical protein